MAPTSAAAAAAAAHQLARRAKDPLIYVWGPRYEASTILAKVLTWFASLCMGCMLILAICGVIGLLILTIGFVFSSLYELVMLITARLVPAVNKLKAKNEARKLRRRERQDARCKATGDRVGRTTRRRGEGWLGGIVNVNILVEGKEGSDVELGPMRNQGPLPVSVASPPAYST